MGYSTDPAHREGTKSAKGNGNSAPGFDSCDSCDLWWFRAFTRGNSDRMNRIYRMKRFFILPSYFPSASCSSCLPSVPRRIQIDLVERRTSNTETPIHRPTGHNSPGRQQDCPSSDSPATSLEQKATKLTKQTAVPSNLGFFVPFVTSGGKAPRRRESSLTLFLQRQDPEPGFVPLDGYQRSAPEFHIMLL
jgi:hypothetical protein